SLLGARSRRAARRAAPAARPRGIRRGRSTARTPDESIASCGRASRLPPSGKSLLEHQHRARDLARLHRPEGVVHILEAAASRDHLVEAKQAPLVEVDVPGHVDLEAVRAHAAALDALFPAKHAALELDLLADGDHADHRRRPARADAFEGLLGGLLQTDGLEGVLD